MKKLITLVIAILVSSNLFSKQKFPFLIRADFGSSNVKPKQSSTFALGIGAETFFGLKKNSKNVHIELNPNLSYLNTGYETLIGGKVKVNYLSLGLPICIKVGEVEYMDNMGIIFGIGPFINYALNGKFKVLETDDYKKVNFGNTTADNRKSTDAGVLLKTGVFLGKLYLGMQYNIGTKNLIPNDRIVSGNYLKTRNFLFFASYALGKSK